MNNHSPIRPRALLLPLALSLGLLLALVLTRPHHHPLPPAAPPLVELNRTNLLRLQNHWCVVGQTNPFSGVMVEYYPGGARMSRSVISNGLLNGLSQGWFTNGQMQIQETYHDSLADGQRTRWYPNGNKLSEATIVQGTAVIDTIFLRILAVIAFAQLDAGYFGHGIRLVGGLQRTGQQGVFRHWHIDGSLAEEIPMHAGRQEGVGRAYYPSGYLAEEVEMRDGKVVNKQTWKPEERKKS